MTPHQMTRPEGFGWENIKGKELETGQYEQI
jgi:hypothetical protein